MAKANNIMYPDYKDKLLKLTKLFLNILIEWLQGVWPKIIPGDCQSFMSVLVT